MDWAVGVCGSAGCVYAFAQMKRCRFFCRFGRSVNLFVQALCGKFVSVMSLWNGMRDKRDRCRFHRCCVDVKLVVASTWTDTIDFAER